MCTALETCFLLRQLGRSAPPIMLSCEPRRSAHSRASLLITGILAFVSIPQISGWTSYYSNNLVKQTTPRTALSELRNGGRVAVTLRARKSACCRSLNLRAAETSTNENNIAVLNERLWSAAELGDEPLIRTLMSVGADVNSQPVLSEPVKDADSEEAKDAIKEIVYGPSALHLAAFNGRSKAVCALVELGADVDRRDSTQSTPLHQAVTGDHLDTVQVLVTLGADLKGKNGKGQTPLDVAKEFGCSPELIELLRALTGEDDTAPS